MDADAARVRQWSPKLMTAMPYDERVMVLESIATGLKDHMDLIRSCRSYQEMVFRHGMWYEEFAENLGDADAIFAFVGFYGRGAWMWTYSEMTKAAMRKQLDAFKTEVRTFNKAANAKAIEEDLCRVYDDWVADVLTECPEMEKVWEYRERIMEGGTATVEIEMDQIAAPGREDDEFKSKLRDALDKALRDSGIYGKVTSFEHRDEFWSFQ